MDAEDVRTPPHFNIYAIDVASVVLVIARNINDGDAALPVSQHRAPPMVDVACQDQDIVQCGWSYLFQRDTSDADAVFKVEVGENLNFHVEACLKDGVERLLPGSRLSSASAACRSCSLRAKGRAIDA